MTGRASSTFVGPATRVLVGAACARAKRILAPLAVSLASFREPGAAIPRQGERLFRSMIDASPVPFALTDAAGNILLFNPAFERIFGYRLEDLPTGGHWAQRAFPDPCYRRRVGILWKERVERLNREGGFEPIEIEVCCADGSARIASASAALLEGAFAGTCLVVLQDITRQRRLEAELREWATTDALTGLANRRHFMDRLAEEQARLRRAPARRSSILVFDIDHFKRINDSHGHAAGDEVLRQTAACVRAELRRDDLCGRIGGEEFAIVLGQTAPAAALALAERLRGQVAALTFEAGSRTLLTTISVGVAPMETDDACGELALARADQAMYRAKQGGRNRVECAPSAR